MPPADAASIAAAAALHQDGGGAAPVLFSRSPPRSLRPRVQFHCAICMSGASQRGCGMTSAPADPQSCCHPSSPRSPSWMVRSPSNQGPGFAARGPEAIGKSIDTPRPSLASCLAGGWLRRSPPLPHTPPPLPRYGGMKTMQWRLLHASLDVDVQGLMRLSCPPTLGLRGGETAVTSFGGGGCVLWWTSQFPSAHL